MVFYDLVYHHGESSLHHQAVRLIGHDGKRLALCIQIQACADKGKDTSFSWESSKFSTYMIAFKDADGGGSGKGSKGNGSINTGDEAHMGLWLTITILAALELAVLTVMRRRRSRRTE